MSETTIFGKKNRHLLGHDIVLIGIMAVLAACGLIYEYLLSHFAGRVLGSVETSIYGMIGLMIVAMGFGSFTAKLCKNPFASFAWLEVSVALLGMTSILVVSAWLAFMHILPDLVLSTYNIPLGVNIDGLFLKLKDLSFYSPFLMGFVLGFFIGMEIPLIARVRQHVYGKHLENNAGTIYGADYIGAGIGAIIWILLMLSIDIVDAAIYTACFNLLAGGLFLFKYSAFIPRLKTLISLHVLAGFLLLILSSSGQNWMHDLSNVLYKDRVVLSFQTEYQYLTMTERRTQSDPTPINDLFINGRLQFSTIDEHIYHSMLVYPAMLSAGKQDKVLVIGGGDGLALRNILRWRPQSVSLIDIDKKLINLFAGKNKQHPELSRRLAELNRGALTDPRVNVIIGDAFVEVDMLALKGERFDVIVVDLPDPHHPDLNKLYSSHFYSRLHQLLNGHGTMVVQSTSPFHAKSAFISIGKTMASVPFAHVEQYRQNVPSFGEWGWTIATKLGQSPKQRITQKDKLVIADEWVTKGLMLAAFEFPQGFYSKINDIKVNRLGSGVVYQYHDKAWRKEEGEVFR